MNPTEYFQSLSMELKAVQNRIRSFIAGAHWPSDGAWKESVLRAMLRRYLPPSYSVGSGFIVTPGKVSTQIDILICDDTSPMLFRDGDFMIATADCVCAVVEVKTRLGSNEMATSLTKLNDISALMRRRCVRRRPFLGLFSYEPTQVSPEDVLGCLKRLNGNTSDYEISALCFGDSQFYRYWRHDPQGRSGGGYDSWHAYDVPKAAPGYFVHNLVEWLFPHAIEGAEEMWYPVDGKENKRVAVQARRGG